MDYVVFGTGYGATLMLLGWALRTFGPVLRYRQDSDGPARADVLMARLSWRRFSSALGAVVATAGIALILITFILIFINPGNVVGSRIAWACFVLVLIAVAAWLWLYVGRYGIYGLLPERPDPATVFRSAPSKPEAAHSARQASPDVAPEYETSHEFDGDEQYVDDDELWYDDEDGEMSEDEEESRYAKYELHHPDDMADTAAYEPIPDQDEPAIQEGNESAMIPSPEADAEEQSQKGETGEDVVGPASGDEEIADVPDELVDEDDAVAGLDEPLDSGEPKPAEHADIDAVGEGVVDDEDDMDAGYVPDDDAELALADTPEGRAEALRRIEAWQPDDGGKEGQDAVSEGDTDVEKDDES